MRLIHLFRAFLKDVRFSSLLLMIMMTGAVFLGIMTLAATNYKYADYNMLKSSPDDTYYLGNLSAPPFGIPWSTMGESLVDELNQLPGIERAYTVKTASPIMYGNEGTVICLLPQDILEDFPVLREMGYDFDKDPNGFVLCSVLFDGFKGDSVTISGHKDKFGFRPFEIKVNSVVSPMYKVITLGGSGVTRLTSAMLLSESNYIIGIDTEENEKLLKEYTSGLSWAPNAIFKLKKDATEAEKEEVFRYAESKGNYASLAEIAEGDLKDIHEDMRLSFPRPLFLFIASLAAYLSITALVVAKKKKELAVYYLCGADHKKCLTITLMAVGLVAFLSTVISIAIVFVFRAVQRADHEFFYGYLFSSNCIWLVLGFFVLTLLTAFVGVFVSLKGKTPVQLLRGVE